MVRYYAHRGLHDSESPENSLSAFKKAVDAGCGIELDVQKTRDDILVVFHDNSLKRMCGADRDIINCTYEEIKKMKLGMSHEGIPKLDEVLNIVDGRVELLIEIKYDGDWKKTTYLTAKMLKNYSGDFVIESFHPLVLGMFWKYMPEVARGQLAQNMFKSKKKINFIKKLAGTGMLGNIISKPDFVAFNYRHRKNIFFKLWKKKRKKAVAWTVRSQKELGKIKREFDSFIFEGFIPDDMCNT